MEDNRIIALYFARSEQAIKETKTKYGRLIFSVAMTILNNRSDAEECENDTYFRAWQRIPPTRPTYFSAFLTKITRNLSITRLHENGRRGPIGAELIFDELEEAIPDTTGDLTDDIALRDALNGFLESLDKTHRAVFVGRYFYMREVKEIARDLMITTGNVKVILFRVRVRLREYLEERGIVI